MRFRTCVGWAPNGAAVHASLAHDRQNGKLLGRPVTAALHADRVQKRFVGSLGEMFCEGNCDQASAEMEPEGLLLSGRDVTALLKNFPVHSAALASNGVTAVAEYLALAVAVNKARITPVGC